MSRTPEYLFTSAPLQRARSTLRPARFASMCQVMRSVGRAGAVTGTGAWFIIGSPYPDGCEWRRLRRFSGCVSPRPSGVDRSADGPGDGPVVRLDDTEFRRNGNVRTEVTAADVRSTCSPRVAPPGTIPAGRRRPGGGRDGRRDPGGAARSAGGMAAGAARAGRERVAAHARRAPGPRPGPDGRRRGARRRSVGGAAARRCPRCAAAPRLAAAEGDRSGRRHPWGRLPAGGRARRRRRSPLRPAGPRGPDRPPQPATAVAVAAASGRADLALRVAGNTCCYRDLRVCEEDRSAEHLVGSGRGAQ